ncbi:rhodanese-like domain-containing protein [Aridibaculum aurantiacum]|uniref:rhodanese-like domain-containing protein n=1 Tax=Aridibaculum aurantiacum TaxID=2810307 RepID=UPI001A973D33|nr:rhodanese-like domain-containing protein [Aridibaculum aurantiacum]
MKQITPKELKAKLAADSELFLLDVREDWEHEAFNIGGKHVPLGEIMNYAPSLPKDEPVIIYCKKGVRSQIAIQRLEQKFGFNNLVNLEGGMEAWKREEQNY